MEPPCAIFRGTREQWDRMLKSFREQPGNYSAAARAGGVEQRTGKRAWERGYKSPVWAKCVRQLFEDEQTALRAELARQEAEREKAAAPKRDEAVLAELDAKQERLREAQAVRAALSVSMNALATSGQLTQARLKLTQQAAEKITNEAMAGNITWEKALQILTKLQWLDTSAVGNLRAVMDALRLHLGPTEKFIRNGAVPTVMDVDGPKAAEAMGGVDNLRQAARDLADGNMTPLVERLIEFQLESQAAGAS